jgi:hypothetical protein
MFHFERRAIIKNAADLPAAVQFAAEVTSYVNKRHTLNMKFGVELFGTCSIHWYLDMESLDQSTQLNAALMQDRDYLAILGKGKALWVDGSLKDTIVSLVA